MDEKLLEGGLGDARTGQVNKRLRQNLPRMLRALAWMAAVFLGLICRCWNWETVFADGGAFFIDGDCYARMTRARMVSESPGIILRRHEFENWPDGTAPHTTAPLDYLIAGLGRLCAALPERLRMESGALDFAGAITGPALFVAGAAGLALVWPSAWRGRWIVLVLYAGMPPVAWAGILGRPDHQALLLPVLSLAFVSSARMFFRADDSMRLFTTVAFSAGAFWGLALWVSLFEPLILLGLFAAAAGLIGRSRPEDDPRKCRHGTIGFFAGLALFLIPFLTLERPAITLPGGSEAFDRWAKLIPELGRGGVADIFSWAGAGVVMVIAGLSLAAVRRDRAGTVTGLSGLGLTAALIGLSVWQRRWSPYAAMCIALLLPVALVELRRMCRFDRWPVAARFGGAAAVAFGIIWQPLMEWERLVFSKGSVRQREEALADGIALRRLALVIGGRHHDGDSIRERRGIMAPYWLCPPLAYWSGLPAVGGTSHQSLPGILATAEFFAAPDWLEAAVILQKRRVRWVVADVAERTVGTALALVGQAAEPAEKPVGTRLENFGARDDQTPGWLRDCGRFGWFRLFEVAE